MGMPPRPGAPFAGGWMPLAIVERKVNALAVGWMVYSGLIFITGLMGLAFARAWMSGHGGEFGHGFGHRYWDGPLMPLFFLKFARVVLILRAGLALAAGIGLMQKTSWGRWVALVAGCLALIHLPFGTFLGIWTLVVLLNAPTAAGYEAMAR